MVNKEGPSRPILLKFIQIECHVSPWMTLNSLNGLAPTNMGILWYCLDISQSPILQRAIEKAIRKCRNYDTQSSLFAIESEGLEQRCNQFV
jgi:hypothetical protein